MLCKNHNLTYRINNNDSFHMVFFILFSFLRINKISGESIYNPQSRDKYNYLNCYFMEHQHDLTNSGRFG